MKQHTLLPLLLLLCCYCSYSFQIGIGSTSFSQSIAKRISKKATPLPIRNAVSPNFPEFQVTAANDNKEEFREIIKELNIPMALTFGRLLAVPVFILLYVNKFVSENQTLQ
jgi:hypothetical protein